MRLTHAERDVKDAEGGGREDGTEEELSEEEGDEARVPV